MLQRTENVIVQQPIRHVPIENNNERKNKKFQVPYVHLSYYNYNTSTYLILFIVPTTNELKLLINSKINLISLKLASNKIR